jgi:hypothetical protein
MGYTHSHAAISPRYYYRLSKEMVTFSRCLTGCYLAVLSRTFPPRVERHLPPLTVAAAREKPSEQGWLGLRVLPTPPGNLPRA